MSDDDKECPECGNSDNIEVVSLDGGGRIGWYCHGCFLFIPEEVRVA